MSARTILVLGATGRTGGRVVRQLLGRGVCVRVVVRSAERLPDGVAGAAGLSVTEADLLSIGDEDFADLVDGCDAVVSCVGHNLTARGMYGRPRDLETQVAEKVQRATRRLSPDRPVRFVLMSSVSVNRPGRADTRRGWSERAVIRLLRGVLPPARDHQAAADFLLETAGTDDAALEWTTVRPDSLKEGEVSAYELHECLVDSLFRPGQTRMANVAHFMCELVTDDVVWDAWKGKFPVIVDRAAG